MLKTTRIGEDSVLHGGPTTTEHVDVRGIWPLYVNNQIAVSLEGKQRDINLEDSREVASHLGFPVYRR